MWGGCECDVRCGWFVGVTADVGSCVIVTSDVDCVWVLR